MIDLDIKNNALFQIVGDLALISLNIVRA